MKDDIKTTISFFLTVIILIVCCLYTYSDYDLPGRGERQIVITSSSSEKLSIPKLVCKYEEYNEIGADFNPIARKIGVHFDGKIKIKQVIIEDDGRIKLISDNEYNDFGETPKGQKFFVNKDTVINRYFVIYLKDKIKNYYDFIGKEIKFSGDFYSMDDRYIVVTNGEIL